MQARSRVKLQLTGSGKTMGQLSILCLVLFCLTMPLSIPNSFLTKIAAILVNELCSLWVVNQCFAGTLCFR
jgi:hypothetical protein